MFIPSFVTFFRNSQRSSEQNEEFRKEMDVHAQRFMRLSEAMNQHQKELSNFIPDVDEEDIVDKVDFMLQECTTALSKPQQDAPDTQDTKDLKLERMKQKNADLKKTIEELSAKMGSFLILEIACLEQ